MVTLAPPAARLRALDALGSDPHEQAVRRALAKLSSRSDRVVRLRRGFVRSPVPGSGSDTKLPPPEQRPPASRLIDSKGVALAVELVLLFRATKLAGRPGAKKLPPPTIDGVDDDFSLYRTVAVPVVPGEGARYAYSSADHRRRRLKAAVDRLAKDQYRLLTRTKATGHGRYRDLRLQREDRDPDDVEREWTLPKKNEHTFEVPDSFFTNGWVHVLTDREIVALLMLLELGALAGWRAIPAWDRVNHYGLGPDAYKQLARAEAFGLVEHEADERFTGEYVADFKELGRPNPHEWSVLPEGFEQPAVDTVRKVLEREAANY
jgi:hypothetical protein